MIKFRNTQKSMIYLIFLTILLSCSKTEEEEIYVPYQVSIVPQSLETIMHSSQDWESETLNYYNVIKRPNGKWQMWYQSVKKGWNTEYQSFLCYAYSINGKNWIKEIPGRENNIIHSGWKNHDAWIEQYVFIDPNDTFYPYRMIYSKLVLSDQTVWITRSKDGIDWVDHKMILGSKHDSQYSVEILPNGNYLIFLRLWDKKHSDRQIGTAIISPNGEILQQPSFLKGGSYYNAPSFQFVINNYILFPTYYNTKSGAIDIRVCFYIDGKFTDVKQSLSQYLFQDSIIGQSSKWAIVSPNLIPTGEINTYWMYYYAMNQYHNQLRDKNTIYCRIKVMIEPKPVL